LSERLCLYLKFFSLKKILILSQKQPQSLSASQPQSQPAAMPQNGLRHATRRRGVSLCFKNSRGGVA